MQYEAKNVSVLFFPSGEVSLGHMGSTRPNISKTAGNRGSYGVKAKVESASHAKSTWPKTCNHKKRKMTILFFQISGSCNGEKDGKDTKWSQFSKIGPMICTLKKLRAMFGHHQR